jgi:cell wall assembly regulator SMI1
MENTTIQELKSVLRKIDEKLKENYRKVYSTLNLPAIDGEIKKLSELVFRGKALPFEIETLFRWHNGQHDIEPIEPDTNLTLLPIDQLIESWDVNNDPEAMKPWSHSWIPLIENGAGDYLVYESAEGPTRGILLRYWHDSKDRPLEYKSLQDWAEHLLAKLQ